MATLKQCSTRARICIIVFLRFSGFTCFRLSASSSTHDRVQLDTGVCWDHAIYLNADNNLERAGVQDAHELIANPHFRHGVTEGYNLKVYIERNCNDRPSRGFTSENIKGVGCDRGKTVFASLSPGQDARRGYEVLQKLNRQPLTDPAQLENFVKAALPSRSSCNQFLVLWNHGMGPFGFGASESFDTHGMKIKDIASVLARRSRKLSLLGFDSCLMSSYEVLQKLTPYSEAILASEEVEPGHGWDYSKFNPAARDAREMGRDFIRGFMDHSHQMPRTLALISSAGFNAFQQKVDSFCSLMSKHLTNGLTDAKRALGHARQKATSFKSAVDSPGHSGSHIDLGKFLEALLTPDALPSSWYDERLLVTQACALYRDAFLEKDSFSSSYTGMSAFFPGASSGKGGFDMGLGNVIQGLMGAIVGGGIVSSLFRSGGERSSGWGSSRMLDLYEEALGGVGAWGTMVKRYSAFQPKSSAVYVSANGQRPATRPEERPGHLQNARPQNGARPNPGWSQHSAAQSNQSRALIQVANLDPFSRNEIEFYGPASLSVTGLEIFYGAVNEEFGYLKLAGSTRPDLGRYNFRGTPTFMWWVDIYALQATFMFMRRLRGCHAGNPDSRCWWMPKVMIMEEVQNSLSAKDEPELIKIPIEYFPDDNSDDGVCTGRGLKGHMVGMIARTEDVGSYEIRGETTPDGWTLNVQSGAGFTTVLDGAGGSFRPQEMVIPAGEDDSDTSGPDFIYSTQNCVLWNGARHQKIFFNKNPEKNKELAAVFRVELDNGRKKDLSAYCDWDPAQSKYKCDATAT